jgi:hypothetical protein
MKPVGGSAAPQPTPPKVVWALEWSFPKNAPVFLSLSHHLEVHSFQCKRESWCAMICDELFAPYSLGQLVAHNSRQLAIKGTQRQRVKFVELLTLEKLVPGIAHEPTWKPVIDSGNLTWFESSKDGQVPGPSWVAVFTSGHVSALCCV